MTQPVPTISRGTLLLAEPFLADGHFDRSVILVCEHNENGTIGFILNRRTEYHLPDVLDDVTEQELDLYIGGPVQQNTLHYLHRVGPVLENAMEVNDHIYWGGNFDQLRMNLKVQTLAPEDIRFFLGYSGWSAGQLDQEVAEETWIVVNDFVIDFFDYDPQELWQLILKHLGGHYRELANYPKDPRLN